MLWADVLPNIVTRLYETWVALRLFVTSPFGGVLVSLLLGGAIYRVFRRMDQKRVEIRERKLSATHGIIRQFSRFTSPAELQKHVAEALPAVASGTHGFVLTADGDSGDLVYAAGSERPPKHRLEAGTIAGAITCYRNQSLTEVPDADACPFIDKEIVRRLGQRSLLYAPVIVDDACVGVLEVEDRERKRLFSREQKMFVEELAALTGLAVRVQQERNLSDGLHRQEKNQAMVELVEGLAEELLGPLSRLHTLLATQISASSDPTPPANLLDASSEAHRALQSLDRYVRGIRPQQAQVTTVDLNAVIEMVNAAEERRWSETGLEVRRELAPEPVPIVADREHIYLVILSLIGHAERLLGRTGARTLQAVTKAHEGKAILSITPIVRPRRSATAEGDESESADDLSTSRGLGINVCRSVIEAAGGKLLVDLSSGRGFVIELQIPQAAAPLPEIETAGPNGAAQGLVTALVIDDDQACQEALLLGLSDQDCRTLTVSNADEALDLCERLHFDWVFCAQRIGTLSGLEIYRRTEAKVGRFVFLLEVDGESSSGRSVAHSDGDSVLYKPVRSEDLARLIAPGPAGSKAVES